MLMTTLSPVHAPVLRSVDRLVSDVFRGLPATYRADVSAGPDVRLRDLGDAFEVKAALPGLGAEDVTIEGTESSLTVAAKRTIAAPEGARFLHRERRSWTFKHTFELPAPVVVGEITAALADGVLTVRAPKRPEVLPRAIEVKVS